MSRGFSLVVVSRASSLVVVSRGFSLVAGSGASSLVAVSRGFSLVPVSRASSLVVVCRLLIAVASLVAEHGLEGTQPSVAVGLGLSSYGFWPLEHRLSSCSTQLIALRHVGSFWIRD